MMGKIFSVLMEMVPVSCIMDNNILIQPQDNKPCSKAKKIAILAAIVPIRKPSDVRREIMPYEEISQFTTHGSVFQKTPDVLYFYCAMRPDYPHKIFPDSRNHFFLLMETLAMIPPFPDTCAEVCATAEALATRCQRWRKGEYCDAR